MPETDNEKETRRLLRAGYKQSAGYVFRQCTQNPEKTRRFYLYSPRALANISGYDPVTESRMITFPMLKKVGKLECDRDCKPEQPECVALRNLAYFTVIKNVDRIMAEYEGLTLNPPLANRDWERFGALLALYRALKPDTYPELLNGVKDIIREERSSSESKPKQLLTALCNKVFSLIYQDDGTVFVPAKEALDIEYQVSNKEMVECWRRELGEETTAVVGYGYSERETTVRSQFRWLNEQYVGHVLKSLHFPKDKQHGKVRQGDGWKYRFRGRELWDLAMRNEVFEVQERVNTMNDMNTVDVMSKITE